MPKVFRVEQSTTQLGPHYSPDAPLQVLTRDLGVVWGLPDPTEDGLDPSDLPAGWVFGSPSMEAVREWLQVASSANANDMFLHLLSTRGYYLLECWVGDDKVRIGRSGRQLVFDRSNCEANGESRQHHLNVLLD